MVHIKNVTVNEVINCSYRYWKGGTPGIFYVIPGIKGSGYLFAKVIVTFLFKLPNKNIFDMILNIMPLSIKIYLSKHWIHVSIHHTHTYTLHTHMGISHENIFCRFVSNPFTAVPSTPSLKWKLSSSLFPRIFFFFWSNALGYIFLF